MSIKPVDTEINFDKKPTFKIRFWIREPPFAPSGLIKKFCSY